MYFILAYLHKLCTYLFWLDHVFQLFDTYKYNILLAVMLQRGAIPPEKVKLTLGSGFTEQIGLDLGISHGFCLKIDALSRICLLYLQEILSSFLKANNFLSKAYRLRKVSVLRLFELSSIVFGIEEKERTIHILYEMNAPHLC